LISYVFVVPMLDLAMVVTQKEGVAMEEEGVGLRSTDGQVIDRTEKVGQFNVLVYVTLCL